MSVKGEGVFVLWNPESGASQRAQALHERLQKDQAFELHYGSEYQAMVQLVRQAAEHGQNTIIAAGGDGTINASVNGLARVSTDCRLGILPLGTGNDLGRTLDIPDDPELALDVIDQQRVENIDLIKLANGSVDRYCINTATAGFSSQVTQNVTTDMKKQWGPLAYVRQAAEQVSDLEPYAISLSWDDGAWESYSAFNVIVANGRYAGRGIEIAPRANPQDGLIELIVVRSGTYREMAALAARWVSGVPWEDEHIRYRQVRRVSVHSESPLPWSIDGDISKETSVTFEICPQKLPIIVGRNYRADTSAPNETNPEQDKE